MVRPVFSLFDNFKVKANGEFVTIAGLTKLNPKTTKEIKKRYRLEDKGWEIQDIYGIEKAFEVEGEVLGDGEDEGNNFIVSLEDAQGDEAKVEFEFVDGTTKYTGTLVVDITTQGGATNDIIMFTGTFYVYGKPTKEVVSE